MTRLMRWHPFHNFSAAQQALARRQPRQFEAAERRLYLPLDAYETDEALVLVAAIPGVSLDEVQITFEKESLTIKGDLPTLGNVDFILQERTHGAFERTVQFNVPVKNQEIGAVYKDGLLTITVPKAEEAKPKSIKIDIK